MSERDYNRQAAKRQRISKTTLIVGVDVGKAFNAYGYEVRFVRTTVLKHHRELDESSAAKSDQRGVSVRSLITNAVS